MTFDVKITSTNFITFALWAQGELIYLYMYVSEVLGYHGGWILTKNGKKLMETLTAAVSFTQKILSAKLVYILCCSTLHLLDLQIFLLPCLKKPERENLEVEQVCGPARRPCKPLFWVFTACKQMKKPRDKMRIHLCCSTTHGRAKLVPHWISRFDQIFTSPASSKTKTDNKFSCVFVWTWRLTKAKLVNNKS